MATSKYWAHELKPKYTDYVYSLRSPITYDVFYIGRTISLKTRLQGHVAEGRRLKGCNKNKIETIHSILAAGLMPIMRVVDKTEIRCRFDEYYANYKEFYWIKAYLDMGWNLTNLKDINRNLVNTKHCDFKEKISNGENLSMDDFYYGTYLGEHVYDVRKLLKFGYQIPDTVAPIIEEPLVYEESEYNDLYYEKTYC